jgi:hypothetical protein
MVFTSSGDPRSSSRLVYYNSVRSPDEVSADYYSFASLAFGLIALTLRIKAAAWLAFFTCLSSLANQKRSEREVKQVFTSVGFAVLGLVLNYITPPGRNAE